MSKPRRKKCSSCGKSLLLSAFYKMMFAKDGLHPYCKECVRRRNKKYYAENQEDLHRQQKKYRSSKRGREAYRKGARKYAKTEHGRRVRRNQHFKSKYGMTLKQHEQMYINQNGCCALCKDPMTYDRVYVDHNHRTGRVRGLLCNRCNHGLGSFGDTVEGLWRAIEYLEGGEE